MEKNIQKINVTNVVYLLYTFVIYIVFFFGECVNEWVTEWMTEVCIYTLDYDHDDDVLPHHYYSIYI